MVQCLLPMVSRCSISICSGEQKSSLSCRRGHQQGGEVMMLKRAGWQQEGGVERVCVVSVLMVIGKVL